MWKRTEADPEPRPAAQPAASPPPARQRDLATIGSSIRIKGDLTGDEDLLVQGQIEGKISLKSNDVTVGQNGRVQADIHGKNIRVEGEVRGNLFGQQEIVIRASGRVQGNLVAPRVTLENGSKFRGSIDMEAGTKPQPPAERKPAATPPGPTPKVAQAAIAGEPRNG